MRDLNVKLEMLQVLEESMEEFPFNYRVGEGFLMLVTSSETIK